MPTTDRPQFRECLQNCKFVGLTQTLDQARAIIPAPTYPEEKSKIDEFHSRYGWADEQLSDGGMQRSVPAVTFDDHSNSDGRLHDHQLFGESYLVLWLCPVDREAIRTHLRSQISVLRSNPKRSLSFSRFQAILDRPQDPYAAFLRGDQDAKDFFKREVVDRLCLLEPDENTFLDSLKEKLKEEITVA